MENEVFAVVLELNREYPPVGRRAAEPAWLRETWNDQGRSEAMSPGGVQPGGACTACAVGSV